MHKANEVPEECFATRRVYLDEGMLEIMLVSEQEQKEYYFLYEVGTNKLAVVIFSPIGEEDGVATIDEDADGSVEYGKDPLDLPLEALEGEYHRALEVLEKTMDTCSQPAGTPAG